MVLVLLGLDLLFHVDELVLVVIELVLQERELLRRYDMNAEAVLQLPSALEAHHTLVDVGGHVGMDVEIKLLDANLVG